MVEQTVHSSSPAPPVPAIHSRALMPLIRLIRDSPDSRCRDGISWVPQTVG